MTVGDRLRLRAEDERDLEILGTMMQDSIAPLADMAYLRDQGRFVMVLNRFMWERGSETIAGEDDGPPIETHFRVHGLLSVQHVRSVQVRDIDQSNPTRLLNVLGFTGGTDHICIEFAGGGTIRIQVDRLSCLLEDVSEPWPTVWRPGHEAGESLNGDEDQGSASQSPP